MILRKFTKHITDQNWFAVGLDVIVVITGIFLGLQVADWNEERKSAELRQFYVERLLRDIDNDKMNAVARVRYFEVVKSYAEQALEYLDKPSAEQTPTSQILIAFMLASSKWESYHNQVTFDELKSTGRIQLIGDFGKREVVNQYYDAAKQRQNELLHADEYFHIIRSIIRPDIQESILEQCEEVSGAILIDLVINPFCDLVLDQERVAVMLQQITDAPAIKSELIYAISLLRFNNNLFGEKLITSDKVLAALLTEKEEIK